MADVKGPAETSQPKNTQTGCHGDLSGGCHGHLAGGYHGDLASGCHDDLAGGCRGDLAGDCRGDLAGGCRGDLAGSCHANHADPDDGDANFELVLDLCKEFLQEKLNIESSYLLDMMYADGAISAREKESVDVLILLLLWIYTPCPCFFGLAGIILEILLNYTFLGNFHPLIFHQISNCILKDFLQNS